MLRSSPFWIAILSLGSITPAAWAQEVPCPSETPPTPTPSRSGPAPPAGTDKGGTQAKIDITSDQATLGVNGNAILQGHVDVHQGDREIRANEVQYDSRNNAIKSEGSMDYTDPIVHVTGEGGSYSPAEGADFRSAQFEMRQRAARGTADTMRLTPEGIINLQGVTFTTCPATDEAWRLRAKDITLDTRSRVGSGRATSVEFEGVPILYLPWLSFPLGTQRKSGFLFPTVGNSSRSGAQLAVPYYWNIAPNADLTFEPMYYSRRGADLGGDLRYLTEKQHGELTWNYLPYDNVFGGSRNLVKLVHVAELPGNFRFAIDAENVSDDLYFEDFSQGPEGTSTAFLQQRAMLTYRDEHWRIDGEAQHFQTIDTTLILSDRPYARVPRLAVSADYGWGQTERLRYGFDSEIVNFQRSTGVTGWRLDLMPTTTLDIDGAGYFVRPGIAWRTTQYELNNVAPGLSSSPSRTLPIASFDTGLLFERDSGSRNQRKLTLEPRVLYLYVPYRRQDNLPLFDTGVPDLNLVELFRTNRFVGADRVGDANQVSVGVTSRLLDARDGRQFLAATLGQTYYFQIPRVVLPLLTLPADLPAGNRSDIVGQLALTAFQHWSADFGLQWNPQTSRSERAQVNLQYKPSGEEVINVGYRYQRDWLEQAEISGAWPISRSWSAFIRGVYSLRDRLALERFAGVEYRSCCWRMRMGARKFVSNRNGSQDTGIYLQLELTGLASVGSASDAFLTEAIRGYAPPGANLPGANPPGANPQQIQGP